MKIIKGLIQGSPEWRTHRATHKNGSEASMMMGCHPNVSRSELLEMRATGTSQEFSEFVERNVLDKGHKVEAAARPFAEVDLGQPLFPVIGVSDNNPELSASFDGLTLTFKEGWECKQFNQGKAATVQDGKIPEADFWQVVQESYVADGARIKYEVTDGTETNRVSTWYEPNREDFDRLLAGWAQFDEDLKNWQPTETPAEVTAASVDDLPAVRVNVSGELSITDNFTVFGKQLDHFLESILIRDPETDQDFADLEAQIKTLKKAEDALDAAEGQLLSQVEAADTAKRQKDQLHKLTRDNRLMAEKLVKERKKAIKLDIAYRAKEAIEQHVKTINAGLPDGYSLTAPAFGIGNSMKGKRTITTLREAANNEVNRAKIEATTAADKLRANIKTIADAGHDHLFADKQTLALKEPDDLATTIKLRINEEAERKRQQAEVEEAERQRKAEDAAERERERIRQEERDKATAEAVARDREEHKAAIDAEAKRREPVNVDQVLAAPAAPAPAGGKRAARSFTEDLDAWCNQNGISGDAYDDLTVVINRWCSIRDKAA